MNNSNKQTKTKFSVVLLGLLFVFVSVLEFHIGSIKADQEQDALGDDTIMMLGNDSIIPVSSPSEPEPKVVKTMNIVMTAYSSTVWQTDDSPFITASNTYVREGIVANNYLPFGTKVRFPELYGDRIFIVEDRMNARKGNYHVDIWFPTYSEAKVFGAQRTYMEVLEG